MLSILPRQQRLLALLPILPGPAGSRLGTAARCALLPCRGTLPSGAAVCTLFHVRAAAAQCSQLIHPHP